MPGRGQPLISQITIAAQPEAGAVARRAIVRWMGGHPRLDDALLALTELVNNAVVHGGLEDGEDLTITMEPEENGLRLTVRHKGIPFDIHELPSPSLGDGASRGLAVVGRIADRWGVDSDGTEVAAWFEVSPSIAGLNGG